MKQIGIEILKNPSERDLTLCENLAPLVLIVKITRREEKHLWKKENQTSEGSKLYTGL